MSRIYSQPASRPSPASHPLHPPLSYRMRKIQNTERERESIEANQTQPRIIWERIGSRGRRSVNIDRHAHRCARGQEGEEEEEETENIWGK